MWRKILTVVAVIMLTAGIGLVLFPIISNYVGGVISNSETEKFDNSVKNIIDMPFDEAVETGVIDSEGYPIDRTGKRISDLKALLKEDLDRLYSDSLNYNTSLVNNQGTPATSDYTDAVLDLSDYGITDGVYCYISAPTIGIRLPVYLGASDSAMSYGAAHMSYTSLPMTTESANCAIAGHTGYIGRIFFDNLRRLNVGDRLSVKNYWETINYKVVDEKIVAENDSSDMYIKQGRQTLTLVTCISDGEGGFDRFLAICERV